MTDTAYTAPCDIATGDAGDHGSRRSEVGLAGDCWEQAIDLNSGQPYWFNRATGVSQWTPPVGGVGAATAVPGSSCDGAPAAVRVAGSLPSAGEAGGAQQQQGQQQGHSSRDDSKQLPDAAAHKPGLYYRDAYGQLQGPFEVEQLRQWRGMLPMDLPVLKLELASSQLRRSSDDGDAPAAAAAAPAVGTASSTDGDGAEKAALGKACWSEHDLAVLLGDDELLARWRLENPEHVGWPGSAPPAAFFEAQQQRGSAQSLAEAVLYGLPAHDEAVTVARLAASSGRTIQEVLDWSRSEDYAVTGRRVAARGRIQAPDAPEHLYSEAASWVNPDQLEQQLAKAAERRKRAPTPQELQQIKKRKQEMKEKKLKAWLLT